MTSRGWDFILWLDTKTTINRWSRMSMTPSYNSRHWWETRGMERWYSHGFQWEKFVWEEKQILCWLREECYARFDCRQEVKVEKRRTAATVKEKGEAVFAWRPKRKEEKQGEMSLRLDSSTLDSEKSSSFSRFGLLVSTTSPLPTETTTWKFCLFLPLLAYSYLKTRGPHLSHCFNFLSSSPFS